VEREVGVENCFIGKCSCSTRYVSSEVIGPYIYTIHPPTEYRRVTVCNLHSARGNRVDEQYQLNTKTNTKTRISRMYGSLLAVSGAPVYDLPAIRYKNYWSIICSRSEPPTAPFLDLVSVWVWRR
jgi:hypothetical protein